MAGSSTEGDLLQVFERLVEDPEFAASVVADPQAALAGYVLSSDEIEALTADAAALEGDVSGFSRLSMGQILGIGGLRTPRLIVGSTRDDFTFTTVFTST